MLHFTTLKILTNTEFMNQLSCDLGTQSVKYDHKKSIFIFLDAVARAGRIMKPKVGNFAKNASVEMAPPSPGEFMQEVNVLKNNLLSGKSSARLAEMSVNEVAAKGLVVAEVAFWFYIGEMIGRRSIIGYNPKLE